jgi:uncharacterized metal-binding protein
MLMCAQCAVKACYRNAKDEMPPNCPMRSQEHYEGITEKYLAEENNGLFVNSAQIEHDGYCEWNRVYETIEFIKRMNYQHVGIAFCVGLQKEAAIFDKLLRAHGIKTSSIICKNGGFDKTEFGVPDESKLKSGCFEAACNPIAQAKLLEEAGTDFNVVIGLCVGHDTLFFKYTNTPFTVLVVKDRVLGHNPCAALYGAEGYFKNKFGLPPKK